MTTEITLSPDQVEALKAMEEWYNSPDKTKRPFFLGGHAGVGKSLLTDYFLKLVGLEPHTKAMPGAVTMAYTGMAAKVMRAKGNKKATTIHKTIYRLIEPSEAEFENLDREMRSASRSAARMKEGDERNILLAHIGMLSKKMSNFYKPTFILDLFGTPSNAKLFVLDEVSMIGSEQGKDLMKFGVPILVIGDPGQLPPVDDGAGFFTGRAPDFMLTKIHRQAEDNPIIRLATLAREGKHIPFETFGDGVEKLPLAAMKPKDLLKFDLVLCGKNNTRFKFGKQMRELKGLKGALPTGQENENIVWKRNNYELGLVNGERVKLSDISKDGSVSIAAAVQSAETINGDISTPKAASIYTGHFMQHVDFKQDRFKTDWKQRKDLSWADWGDITTVHGAQGTEQENVCVIDDGFKVWKEDAHKMLYTAITRARSKLTIYGG